MRYLVVVQAFECDRENNAWMTGASETVHRTPECIRDPARANIDAMRVPK